MAEKQQPKKPQWNKVLAPWKQREIARREAHERNLKEAADYEMHICDLEAQIAMDKKQLAVLKLERELLNLQNVYVYGNDKDENNKK